MFTNTDVIIINYAALTLGLTCIAVLKQSTALSYSPVKLNRTPRPHCNEKYTFTETTFLITSFTFSYKPAISVKMLINNTE